MQKNARTSDTLAPRPLAYRRSFSWHGCYVPYSFWLVLYVCRSDAVSFAVPNYEDRWYGISDGPVGCAYVRWKWQLEAAYRTLVGQI